MWGPRGRRFPVSEVPLCTGTSRAGREIRKPRTLSNVPDRAGEKSWIIWLHRGTSLIRNSPFAYEHHTALDSSTVGSWEGGVSCERGTPVGAIPEKQHLSGQQQPGFEVQPQTLHCLLCARAGIGIQFRIFTFDTRHLGHLFRRAIDSRGLKDPTRVDILS